MAVTHVKDMQVLSIYVKSLEISEAFYHEYLGFKRFQDMDPGILMRAGAVTLYMEESRKPDGPSTKPFGFSPCFETESIKASFASLREAGVEIETEYQEFGPQFAFFRILDPDGNLIELAGSP